MGGRGPGLMHSGKTFRRRRRLAQKDSGSLLSGEVEKRQALNF